ncbi:sensor histidine kinase [Actinoplanes auranticolor]|nr:histidine kinase [Actinoplanes auranticolor]
MQVRPLIAYGIAGVAVVVAAAGAVFAHLSGDPGDLAYLIVATVLGLLSVGLGVVVAVRRPDNIVGALLAWVGLLPIGVAASDVYVEAVAQRPDVVPVSALLVALHAGDWMFLYVPPALLALTFPDGRVPGRRWRWVGIGLIAVPVAFTVLVAFDPAPFPAPFTGLPHVLRAGGLEPVLMVAALALLPVFLGLLVATAVSVVTRHRRETDPVRRAQIKWFALGALFIPATLVLCWVSYLFLDGPDLVLLGLAATYVAIPAATAIAVLRHDLYDVDRALSATVTYGIVTTALIAFYTAATFLAGVALGRESAVAAAAATAVCAVALAPLRSRLQRQVDRRLYPVRRAALTAIEDLRRRTHDGTAQPEQLEAELRVALRDPDLRIGYRLPGTPGLVDARGEPLRGSGTPVVLGGTDIGELIHRRGSRELTREIATACALLVEVVRLRIELSGALRDVESSRARLLTVSYEERRRLERDLHDGAQQRLVALGMALRVGQRHLDDGGTDVTGLLDTAVAELGTAVAELRRIAHGLRPSSLDDGLVNALTMLVGRVPVPITLDVQPELRNDTLPDVVATTAYYVASEAVVNAMRHARAASIGLRLTLEADALTVRVHDDGPGGAILRAGAGLAGLSDRVAAAGGGLRLTSPLGNGTVVEAVLPCGS